MANKKAKGKRGKTRQKLKRSGPRLSVSARLSKPEIGSRVLVNIDSSVHSGIPPARFHGMHGIVKAVKKNSVVVSVGRAKNEKTIVVHSSHLNIVGSESR